MKKIGIVGAGQAGQRIAVALSAFSDVRVAGVVDPKNGRSILSDPNSRWAIPGVKFFDDDDQMLAEGYDAVAIAADPINVAYQPLGPDRKMAMLARNKVTCPILWERPFGFLPEHPESILEMVPSKAQSIISFARFGLPAKLSKSLIESGTLGEPIDFEIYLTLNCGLAGKTWRHLGEAGVPQPVHFLDNAFELVEAMGLGSILSVVATRQDAKRDGISFDEKWDIAVTLANGVSGRIIGIQYTGDSEFLYSQRSLRIVGTKGALVSSFGKTYFIDSAGNEHPVNGAAFGIDPRITVATDRLITFFKEVDGYPKNALCRGEAQSLAECLRTWVDSLTQKKVGPAMGLPTHVDATRYLSLAQAAISSASGKMPVSTAKLYKSIDPAR